MTTQYIPISLDSLRTGTHLPFNVFQRVQTPKGENFILCLSKDLPYLPAHKERMLDNNIRALFVSEGDKRFYQHYVDNYLSDIVKDENITSDEKARILVDVARMSIIDVFRDKRQPESIQQAAVVVANITKFLLGGPDAFLSIFKRDLNGYYLYSHSIKVCVYAVALGRRIGLKNPNKVLELGIGSFFHDVGMGDIPENKFMKPGFLTESDWTFIKRHPHLGGHILGNAKIKSDDVLAVVRQHHEKLDGSGYPWGLKKGNIHPYARLTSIADIFDALTSRRPYRPQPATTYQALREMRFEMKDSIDQDLLAHFVRMLAG